MSARRLLALTAAAGLALGAVLAAAPAQAGTPRHDGHTFTSLPARDTLSPGGKVTVTLKTNLTTGYSWSTRVTGTSGAVKVSKGVYTAPTGNLVGAPGTTTWTITAKSAGRAVITFLATPPGGGTPESDGRLVITVR